MFNSKTKFAAAIGVSRTALNKWLIDPRWPLSTSPPWTDDDVAKAKDWRLLLQPYRSRDPVENLPPGDEAPDQITLEDWLQREITLEHLIAADGRFAARHWLGNELFARQTTADLQSLAEFMREAVQEHLGDVPETATAADYAARVRGSTEFDEGAAALLHVMFRYRWHWYSGRFQAEPEFWKKLPPAEIPSDGAAKWITPGASLEHRRLKKGKR